MKKRFLMFLLLALVLTIFPSVNEAKKVSNKIEIINFETNKYKQRQNIPYYQIYLETIIETESDFIGNAVSKLGKNYGMGLMQISKICLEEYNRFHIKKYNQNQLFDPHINVLIGSWYFFEFLPVVIQTYDIEELYLAYNVGCGNYKNHRERYRNHNPSKRFKRILIKNIKKYT